MTALCAHTLLHNLTSHPHLHNLTLTLISHPLTHHTLTPQAKKDVAQIFNNILRRQIGTRSPTVEYVCTKSEILFILIRG